MTKNDSRYRIPWQWKTPSGYLACVCVQYIWIHSGIFSVICTLPLIAGFCSLFEAFTFDINKTLADLNDEITDKREQVTMKNRTQLYRKLTEIAAFHSDAKELIFLLLFYLYIYFFIHLFILNIAVLQFD